MAAQWTGKVIGGLLGMVTLGPPGALLGVLLGHQWDIKDKTEEEPVADFAAAALVAERFFRTTFRVMGHIAKSDGRVSEQEIQAARSVMNDLRLSSAQIRAAIEHFTAGKQPDFNLDSDLETLRHACRGRPDVLRIFVEVQVRAALAGNNLDGPVRSLMQRVASKVGISGIELAHIEAVLRIRSGSFKRAAAQNAAQQIAEAYRVLEVPMDASNNEVVKAYRRQLSRHHPDKLKANGLPESMIEHAKQRTQQIIEAYELIKERRGIA
jgi:DnaJ like chaperone protein